MSQEVSQNHLKSSKSVIYLGHERNNSDGWEIRPALYLHLFFASCSGCIISSTVSPQKAVEKDVTQVELERNFLFHEMSNSVLRALIIAQHILDLYECHLVRHGIFVWQMYFSGAKALQLEELKYCSTRYKANRISFVLSVGFS